MSIQEKGQQIELDESNQDIEEVGDILSSLTQLSVTSDDSVEKKHTYLPGIVSKTGSRILYQIPADIALRQPVVLG